MPDNAATFWISRRLAVAPARVSPNLLPQSDRRLFPTESRRAASAPREPPFHPSGAPRSAEGARAFEELQERAAYRSSSDQWDVHHRLALENARGLLPLAAPHRCTRHLNRPFHVFWL